MKKFWSGMVLWLFLCAMPLAASAAEMLVPGGQVVGLELGNDTVTVAAFDETLGEQARQAGVRVGDRIVSIDGRTVRSAEDVRRYLASSNGAVDMVVFRDGGEQSLHIRPGITGDGPKLGVYLRSGVTGIGTVTFYDPESGRFGTLGHGVNGAGGELLQMASGHIYPARVLSVRKGKAGEPGQLMGTLAERTPLGTLTKNTAQGVFGGGAGSFTGEAVPVASSQSVHTGAAAIRSTVSGNGVEEYSVEILKIYPTSRGNGRNMLIRVTDPALLEATGGIVQGMSGSPILQDGRLIGAVTHVLVNDPTTGYGIFIENMLGAAE